MIEFWKAALSLMINPDDKFISFPDGVDIFDSKGFGSAFIIRECYKDLWKLITEDKKYNGWIVTGNPGIECRSGGVTQVVVVFGQPVTFTGASVMADIWFLRSEIENDPWNMIRETRLVIQRTECSDNRGTITDSSPLQFEPVSRGRFEKSEPTIIDGQDLDVPTFLRKNVKVRWQRVCVYFIASREGRAGPPSRPL